MMGKENFMSEIVSYIKKNLKKGYTKESLKWALLNQGYSRLEVEKALKRADQELSEEVPELKTKPEIKYEIVEPKELARKVEEKKTKKSFWDNIFE